MDIALATCRELPEPDPDAAPLDRALAEAGIRARWLAWDDPGAAWSDARITLLRSTWNYPLRPEAFVAWAEATDAVARLCNPLPVVRWNVHKGYLMELERRGLSIVPTELLRRGSSSTLAEVLRKRGWDRAVVKPAISAGSFKTLRVETDGPSGNLSRGERHLSELLDERDVLVQAYLDSVEHYGERALVWIDGELTHAVRKSARFQDQDESVSDAVEISPAEAALARHAVATIEHPVLYARIDLAPGPEGRPVVMELELIEPSLFFAQCPQALDRFVRGLARRLDRS